MVLMDISLYFHTDKANLFSTMYKKLGVAVAFSPTCEAIIGTAARLQNLLKAELTLIHVGEKKQTEEEYLQELVQTTNVNRKKLKIVWEKGSPASKILSVCKKEKVDLLIAGALKKENIVKFYIGSIARRLIRKANCSVLMLIEPTLPARPFKKIVIDGTEGLNNLKTIERGIQLSKLEEAQQVHIFKAIKLFGLSMAITGEEASERDYEEKRREIVSREISEIEQMIDNIDTDDLRVNIKIAAGKPGYELQKFTQKARADLLIVKGPGHRLNVLDRLFPYHLETVVDDLPSNILIDNISE